jgi:hypothetical protein
MTPKRAALAVSIYHASHVFWESRPFKAEIREGLEEAKKKYMKTAI